MKQKQYRTTDGLEREEPSCLNLSVSCIEELIEMDIHIGDEWHCHSFAWKKILTIK